MQRNQTKNKNALRFLPGKHKIDCGFLISINGWEIIMAQVNQLGTDRIGKLVLRLAIPSMLAQFVNVLYSIVDRMYIGHIPDVGALALTGVGVCMPLIMIVSGEKSGRSAPDFSQLFFAFSRHIRCIDGTVFGVSQTTAAHLWRQ